jgi:hypothetical protein
MTTQLLALLGPQAEAAFDAVPGCVFKGGPAAAVPPSSVMNSRRFMPDMGGLSRCGGNFAHA